MVTSSSRGDENVSVGGTGRKNLTMKWCHGHSHKRVEHAIDSVAGEGAAGAIHVSVDPWA